MSSPLSSLRKSNKHNPLIFGHASRHETEFSVNHEIGQRSVPFKNPDYSVDEKSLLEDITTNMASSRLKKNDPFRGGLPKLEEPGRGANFMAHHSPRGSNQGGLGAPNDHELMTSMMNRIGLLESKDKKIRILEDKLKILQKTQGDSNANRTNELEKKCLLLQQQVHEMETFLSDYGMVWVESSLSVNAEYKVDYDVMVENIQDLNVLAGEGISKIQHTTDGARLKKHDGIPLTFYANGIVMFSGPFRPFTDPTTQQFIQDITDGYFPSELQSKYPDGVPFIVSDKRSVYFQDKRPVVFTGAGQVLGGETKPSRLVPSSLDKGIQHSQDLEVTSQLPGPQYSADQFLQKLPKTVIKDGKVIDIRQSVASNLKQMDGNEGEKEPAVTIIETETVKDMKKRLDKHESDNRPITPRNTTTLRIKAESGNQTYILKMKFNETIGDLRRYIDLHRPVGAPDYQIVSAYPNRIFDNKIATLYDSRIL
ncbi:hypothetical protein KUTeg_007563 [Tegillarca granosa]|uniref:SEP domain-containing protein n=1 Tax=Tegillarca granosa TaxID=220873 RepID=A0ABQ9FDL1_TEGGR|nr:hypothetical protein KUTeg_007563 [Tegillarca granosa]